jgi:acyl-CoA synthetase (AMP-forming)/AMP-acid ligase II
VSAAQGLQAVLDAAQAGLAAQRAAWDLSALRVVMSAAEPVRPDTVDAFLKAFRASGLDPRAFCPAYGLAEHTVGVTVRGQRLAHVDRPSGAGPDLRHSLGCAPPCSLAWETDRGLLIAWGDCG